MVTEYDTPNKIDVGEVTKQEGLPVYTAFTTVEFSHPTVGREYEIGHWSYDGEERNFDKEFDATLIAARQYGSFEEVENVTLAYVTDEAAPQKAMDKVEKCDKSSSPPILLVFIRSENAKRFVMNGEIDI